MIWTGTIDDVTARPQGALLRVEQMDGDLWWWRVTFDDETWHQDYEQTKEMAQIRAEQSYRRGIN